MLHAHVDVSHNGEDETKPIESYMPNAPERPSTFKSPEEENAWHFLLNQGFCHTELSYSGEQRFPDFAINTKLAIEETRLHNLYKTTDDIPNTFENSGIRLSTSIENILNSFGTATDGYNHSVRIEFQRPLEAHQNEDKKANLGKSVKNENRRIISGLRDQLRLFTKAPESHKIITISDLLKIELRQHKTMGDQRFFLGEKDDKDNAGGWVGEAILHSTEHAIAAKNRTAQNNNTKYDEYWLILTNFVTYYVNFPETTLVSLRELDWGVWSKLIFLTPDHPNRFKIVSK